MRFSAVRTIKTHRITIRRLSADQPALDGRPHAVIVVGGVPRPVLSSALFGRIDVVTRQPLLMDEPNSALSFSEECVSPG